MAPGLYLHVPYCARLCHYCDFNRIAETDESVHRRYAAALRADLGRVAGAREDWPDFGSIFVGGGTPTLLPADELAEVVAHARKVLPFAADTEITVEANPETVDERYFAALRAAGVNRVSMGAQSFAPHVLDALGRWHTPGRPQEAVVAAGAAGIERVSLDLIYGTPGESDDDWRRSLETALGTGVAHLSAYALTVEAGTEYAAGIRTGAAVAPDEDVQARRMELADRVLAAGGLERYEISNWARSGQECRHNLVYWRGGDWLGVGAGAHGHWQGRRWWSVRPPGRYIELVESQASPVAGEEVLDEATRRVERLMMGLRLAEGVARAEVEPVEEAAVIRLVGRGLLADEGGRLRVTDEGRALAGGIIEALVP